MTQRNREKERMATEAEVTLQLAYDAAMDDLAEGAVRWLGGYIESLTGEQPTHETCSDTAQHGSLFANE